MHTNLHRNRAMARAGLVALAVITALAVTMLAPSAHAAKGKPRIKGVVAVGKTVTCQPGKLAGAGRLKYTWKRNGKAIGGKRAKRQAYRVTRKDGGDKLSCAVKVRGQRRVLSSAAVTVVSAPQNTVAPSLTRSGNVLTCHPGTWINHPDVLLYSWQRNGSPYGGTAATQSVDPHDDGVFLCLVAGRNAAGQSGYVVSSGVNSPGGGGATQAPVNTSAPSLAPQVPAPGVGTTVYPADGSADSTSGDHHGTWSGTEAYVPGRNGGAQDEAFDLDGSSSITMDTAVATFGTDAFAISFDVRTSDADASSSILGARGSCTDDAAGWFDLRGGANLVLEVGGDHYAAIVAPGISDGQWHRVVIERTDTEISLTVDGVTTTAPSAPADVAPTAPFGISTSPCIGVDGTTTFDGLIDNLRIGATAAPGATTTLECVPGTWSPAPDRLYYSWTRNGSPVPGETTSTLEIDDDATYVCLVAGRNGAGQSGYIQSNTYSAGDTGGGGGNTAGAPVNTTPPSLSGTGHPGDPLTCDPGVWTNDPTHYTYTWARNSSEITGATSSTYTPSAADEGAVIECRVAGWNGSGGSGQVSSSGMTIAAPVLSLAFSNTPDPLASNYPSWGFESVSFAEYGGAVTLENGITRLDSIGVTLSTWACETGDYRVAFGQPGACVTTPGATFQHDMTVNVYEIDSGSPTGVGDLITSVTETQDIAYRPSSSSLCPFVSNSNGWHDGTACYSGYANNVDFDLGGVTVPQDVIVSFAYNTSHHGYAPLDQGNTLPPFPMDQTNIVIAQHVAPEPASPSAGAYVGDGGPFVAYGRSGNPSAPNPFQNQMWGAGYTPMFSVTGY